MPGERRATLVKSKGIHDLAIHEQHVLVGALKNNTLTVKTVATDALEDLIASRVPIIVREAPSTDSHHTHGRQVFANGQIDRLGLSHLGNTPLAKSCAVLSKWQRLCMFLEVPQAPPSWKLKAIRRRSLDFGPNNSDLIPQITAIRDDEVGVGAIKDEEAANDAKTEDEEEIDKLFASQEGHDLCKHLEPPFNPRKPLFNPRKPLSSTLASLSSTLANLHSTSITSLRASLPQHVLTISICTRDHVD
ncbi:hypothetical protein BDR07DRAFT_1496650 [Suillus spraguei]|nr:hypothetical protein BDR07DRAFT_1496650 [Suillus spraguei]